MRYTFAFIASIILLSSCVSQTKMLQLMNTGTKLPSTNPDPDLFLNHVSTNIALSELQGIRQWPQVIQQTYSCTPVIFFNTWHSAYNCQIGIKDVEQHLKPNFEYAIKRKFSNSDLFKHRIALDTTDYTLEVSVDTIKSNIPFVSKGTFVFAVVAYSYWFREGVDASKLAISTSYKFSKNGQIITQGSLRTTRNLEVEKNNIGSKKNYMQRYLTNYFGELNAILEENAGGIVQQLEAGALNRQ